MTADEFLHAIAHEPDTHVGRAVALLWFLSVEDRQRSATAVELCRALESAGFARQNASRMTKGLESDRRTTKAAGGAFRIRVDRRSELDEKYSTLLDTRPILRSNAVLPADLFVGTRGYIEKVVAQVNASFEASLFDCTAVMCRRLLETLIIETYEAKGWADDLRGSDGRFMMFSGLLAKLESDKRLTVGRNALEGLKAFKKLGDQSAHDRRFNARRDDITRIRDGLRVACEDLLHLSGLART
jgi:hypothetical protein